MKNHTIVTVSLVTSTLLAAGTALAQPTEVSTSRSIPAISNALEVAIGGSASQGSGGLGDGMEVEDVAGAGGGLEMSVGYRATPNLLIGGYASLAGFGDPDVSSKGAVTASTGIKADWHFLPAASIDPWVSVGAGLKFMGIEDGETDHALTGLELGKFQVGVDYRVSPRFAIGPVIGASATLYTHAYDDVMSDDGVELDDKKVNWTFSAGFLGRFDAFGSTR